MGCVAGQIGVGVIAAFALITTGCGDDASGSDEPHAGSEAVDANGATQGPIPVEDAKACPDGLPGPRLVRVPAPEGSDAASYCIDATEVTVEHYLDFLDARVGTASQTSDCEWNMSYLPVAPWPPPPGFEKYPVTFADWCDATAYCTWAGKRLCGRIGGGSNDFEDFGDPRRSQWFNACSGQGSRVYPYGNEYDPDACKNAEVDYGGVVPVGSKATCEGAYQGLFDLSGNVDEWEDSCRETDGRKDLCRLRGNGDFGYMEVPGFELGPAEFRCAYGGKSGDPQTSAGIRCCAD